MNATTMTYYPGTSVVHRLPTGVKLTLLVVAAALMSWWNTPVRVACALALVVLLYAVARIPPQVLASQLRSLAVLVVVLSVFQVIFAGWERTVVVVGALVALILLASLVTLTTRASQMIDTIVRFCRPLRVFGVDTERMGLALSLGIRSTTVVVDLARQVREAQIARGCGSSLRAFATPFLVRALRRADNLGDALVARGADDH